MVIQVDVLVVGGGPAGLAAGLALSAQGIDVLVCEKSPFPVDKACGEGIMPTGVRALEQLGVSPIPGVPFTGIHYRLAGSPDSVAADFAEGPGRALRRTDLSQALLQRCLAQDSLRVRAQCPVRLLERTDQGICASIGDERAVARLVLAADGLHSRVRRWAGLELAGDGSRQRWGLRQHYAVEPWSERVEVTYARGCEAYVWPSSTTEVGVSVLYGAPAQGHGMRELLRPFPELYARLRGARSASSARGAGPLRQRVKRVEAPGVVLLGDAAGYLDACTGEGISLALAQAMALGPLVRPLLEGGSGLVESVPGYHDEYLRITRSYRLTTAVSLWISRSRLLQKLAVRALAANPGRFQTLLSLNMGSISTHRALWHLATGRTGG